MSMIIEGVDMPKGTNMMLLISPDGDVWEMGDLLGNDKHIDGAKARQATDDHQDEGMSKLTEEAKSLIHFCPGIINGLAERITRAMDDQIVKGNTT